MADDELAAFQAELASIEGAGDAPEDGSASPEEKRFEDDDGTVYVWDARSRKFAPEGEDVPAPAAGAAPAAPVRPGAAARPSVAAVARWTGGGGGAGPGGAGGTGPSRGS